MATLVQHIQKALGHRVPLIKFKYGGNRMATQVLHEANPNKNTQTSAKAVKSQPGSSLEFWETPLKYRRRPLTQAEIDLVSFGGTI